ncbi:SpoIIE family protein phosphatase [soil metagenome]
MTTYDAYNQALRDDDPQLLYENAPCGYISTLPDSTIVKVNTTFLTMTGFTRDELIGRTFASLLTPSSRTFREAHLLPMIQLEGSIREIALDIVKADGKRLPLLINATLDRDAYGAPHLIRAAVFDVSARREYERELIRAKRKAEESEALAVALAQTLQNTLIPPTAPYVPGLDVAAVYRSAGDGHEVGGDFYDVFQIGLDDWVAVVGDVRGKGVEAAIVTSLVRYSLRALAVRFDEPSGVLHALNETLVVKDVDRFSTVAFLRLRREERFWSASLGLGGHPLAMVRYPDGEVTTLGAPGTIVGVLDAPRFHDTHTELASGTTIVLYTDGVTEARRGDEFYGDERLSDVIATHTGTAQELADLLVKSAVDFQQGMTRDDIAVVVVTVPL